MIFYHKRFKEIRKDRRWSLAGIAEKVDLCRQTVSSWEKGDKSPSEEKLRAVAKILDVNITEISNLTEAYPVSDQKLINAINGKSETFVRDSFEDVLATAYNNLTKLDSLFTENSAILKIILNNSSHLIYIKDCDQKYLVCNKAFLEAVGLKSNYIIRGKADHDIFNRNESKFVNEQDSKVLLTGKPIKNFELYIPGTRKKRWGLASKIPIFDEKNKITGVMGIITDITDRKKIENQRKILELAVSKIKGGIWIAKGINKGPGLPIFKQYIFSSATITQEDEVADFWGIMDVNKLTTKDASRLWQESLTDESKDKLLEFKKNMSFPVTRTYEIKSPITDKRLWITEDIYFDKKDELFIGYIKKATEPKFDDGNFGSFDNLILWNARCFKGGRTITFNYPVETEFVTGYSSSYFAENNLFLTDIATENFITETVKKRMFNGNCPFSISFTITTKSGDLKNITGRFFKKNSNDAFVDEYYGFFYDTSI